MSENVYVNADRTAVVDETAPGKKWQMPRKEAQRLGLLPDGDQEPQERRARKITNLDSGVREDTQRPLGTKKQAAKK